MLLGGELVHARYKYFFSYVPIPQSRPPETKSHANSLKVANSFLLSESSLFSKGIDPHKKSKKEKLKKKSHQGSKVFTHPTFGPLAARTNH